MSEVLQAIVDELVRVTDAKGGIPIELTKDDKPVRHPPTCLVRYRGARFHLHLNGVVLSVARHEFNLVEPDSTDRLFELFTKPPGTIYHSGIYNNPDFRFERSYGKGTSFRTKQNRVYWDDIILLILCSVCPKRHYFKKPVKLKMPLNEAMRHVLHDDYIQMMGWLVQARRINLATARLLMKKAWNDEL